MTKISLEVDGFGRENVPIPKRCIFDQDQTRALPESGGPAMLLIMSRLAASGTSINRFRRQTSNS
ncbi:MAG TPA: hypothetical protein VKS24_02210 [Bradyrhizobium sp.]|nr:hypothetical protein [Bradyrhizobium sp.]